MSIKKLFFTLLILTCAEVYPQNDLAFHLLLFSPSPKLNGAGATGTASLIDDPYKFFFNPAHLGYSAGKENFSSGFYLNTINVSDSYESDEILISNVFTVGYNLKKIYPALPVSIGFGYSRANYDFGSPIGGNTFSSFSFGVCYNSIINLSAGIAVKDITSKYMYGIYPDGLRSEIKNYKAFDYGLLVNIPLNNLLKEPVKFNMSGNTAINADIDYTVGYAIKNIGDEIKYEFVAQKVPLVRTARLAHNLQLSLKLQSAEFLLELLNFSYSLDAEDILVKSNYDGVTDYSTYPTYEYKGLFGDIKPVKNLFFGKTDSPVILHKGVIVELCETFTLAKGGFNGRFYDTKTIGYGLRLKGLLKVLNMEWRSKSVEYITNHFDMQFIYSNYHYYYESGDYYFNFSGITITVGGF